MTFPSTTSSTTVMIAVLVVEVLVEEIKGLVKYKKGILWLAFPGLPFCLSCKLLWINESTSLLS